MTFVCEKFWREFWDSFSVSATVCGFEMAVRCENKKRSGADLVNILVIMISLKGENDFR